MGKDNRRKRAYRPSITITPGRRVTEYRVPVNTEAIDPSLDWYLVSTQPKQEARAKLHLERAGYKVFLPTFRREILRENRKPRETVVAMFPGYVFISGKRRIWPASVEGVQDVVRDGLVWSPMRKADEERGQAGVIETIIEFANTPVADPPVLQPGDRVALLDGPFADFFATVSKVLAHDQAELLIGIMGRETKVRADIAQLIAA
jgi:transcriptional antiterminator RfaH